MAESQIIGIGDLSARFKTLSTGMERRVSRVMVVAGGQIIKKEARALVVAGGHRKTGAMLKNIAIKREPNAPTGTAQYHLGVRNGYSLTRKQKQSFTLVVTGAGRIAKRYADNPFYWRFIALGTRHIAADNFLSNALENKRGEAIEAMGQKLSAELDKAGQP